jgi:GH25 family lysozyme M1 (1,4-beta-N-acetylmuramidase)
MKNLKKIISLGFVAVITATFFISQNAYAYKGIDISACNWDNGRINFNEVKGDSVEAVICKATEGVDWQDDYLDSNYWGAKNAGIKHIGFYHFMSEKTDPSQQARDFWNAIKDKNYDIMPCLDVETNNYNRSAYEITNRCLSFIQTFKELSGQNVMLYSGAYFSRDNLDMRIKTQPLWVASYGRNPIPTGFVNVVGWQYTETGEIGGVNGCCDVNDFNDGMLLENSNYIPSTPTVIDSQDNGGTQVGGDDVVAQLQRLINEQGFGDIDVDNIAGNETLGHAPLIKKGAEGEITKWIQLRVGMTGNEVDGVFGSNTKQAVISFQSYRGISADGVVGRNTWRELLNM